jgi:hypothetical protein
MTGLPYARVDGVPLLDDPADLATATHLDVPLSLHANGEEISGGNQIVYTGSASPGELATDAESCDGWTSPNSNKTARVGWPTQVDEQWWDSQDAWHCNTYAKVYCFEE